MAERNIAVVEKKMSDNPYEKRYVVIDKDSGEVLDDAQGYGYKTARNAHRAYAYKTRDKSKDRKKEEKARHIKQWIKQHPDFVDGMERLYFEILKGSWGPNQRFDAKFVKEMLKANHLTPDFTAGELLRVWGQD